MLPQCNLVRAISFARYIKQTAPGGQATPLLTIAALCVRRTVGRLAGPWSAFSPVKGRSCCSSGGSGTQTLEDGVTALAVFKTAAGSTLTCCKTVRQVNLSAYSAQPVTGTWLVTLRPLRAGPHPTDN